MHSNFFRASGEAILGTLKYFKSVCTILFFRASGEAILGTLKYLSKTFAQKENVRASGEAIVGTLKCFF